MFSAGCIEETKMDVVDIGGASAKGVPPIPAIETISFDNAGMIIKTDFKGTPLKQISSNGPADLQTRNVTNIPENVAKAAHEYSTVAYPDLHPGNRTDLKRSPTGALVVGVNDKLSLGPENGDSRGDVSNKEFKNNLTILGAEFSYGTKAATQSDVLSAFEKEENEIKPSLGAELIAKSDSGVPLIEVIFDTSIGMIASYYNKVVCSGPWIILVVDNRNSAKQRFIPKADYDDNGKVKFMRLVITGKDKQESIIHAAPINMVFTIDNYDMVVMMLSMED